MYGNCGLVPLMTEIREQFTVLVENWILPQTLPNIRKHKECMWSIDIRLCTPEVRNICLSIHLHLSYVASIIYSISDENFPGIT
jgi:hypothetical protein